MNKLSFQCAVLVVDDDRDAAVLMRDALRRNGYLAEAMYSASECLSTLRRGGWDVVVTDVNMDEISGIELCHRLRDDFPDVLAIVITGQAGLEPAIEAIQAGAYDFVTKPTNADALTVAVSRAAEHVKLRCELRELRDSATRNAVDGITGSSQAVCRMRDLIGRVADSDTTVLITGESGTGKELVARAIHARSTRRDQPFVAVNCAAMPASLLESELFGHARGAFTDARNARRGLFLQAEAGTIFLDEIGEMPLEMQVKLLRALQERTVRPVGDDVEVPFGARILAATNRDLERDVERKRFREDLYYRINVVPIAVPPLRERDGDILLLAQHFVQRSAARTGKAVRGFTTSAARRLVTYDWPGNIRELENCVERAVALCRFDQVTVDDLPQRVVESAAVMPPTGELIPIEEMSRRYVGRVLAAVNGNKAKAARLLGIDRRSLYRRLVAPAATGAPERAELG